MIICQVKSHISARTQEQYPIHSIRQHCTTSQAPPPKGIERCIFNVINVTPRGSFIRKIAAVYSDEPLEPILFCLAYGAYPRWLIPGAEIPADLAPPDRVG